MSIVFVSLRYIFYSHLYILNNDNAKKEKRLSVCLIELFRPIANQAILLFVKMWCGFLDCLYYTTFGSFCLQRIRSTFIVLATWDGHLDYSFVIFSLPQYVPMLYLLLYACLESLNPAVRL